MDRRLATQDIEPVILHRGHQIKRPAQVGGVLRRDRKRWNARRLFTVLHNISPTGLRCEHRIESFFEFVYSDR